MFSEGDDNKNSEELENAYAEARGTDPNVTNKIKWLKAKWTSELYNTGEEACLMQDILFSMSLLPIHIAVIADNLPYFKANYKYDSNNIGMFLQEACLCGSQNIADYLVTVELKSSYKERPGLLAYIAASPNMEWAKQVARILVEEKLPMPRGVYRLTDGRTTREILAIFKEVTDNPPLRFTNGNSHSSSSSTPTIEASSASPNISPQTKPLR
jgi:hypothetical protein